jgi:hypothetical protein
MADATSLEINGVDPGVDSEKQQQAEQGAKRLLQEGATTDAPAMPESLRFLAEKLKLQEIELKKEYAKQEIGLRRNYAAGLLIILSVQLLAADLVFWVYAEVGEHWQLSDGVIQIWLAAAVVQIVGVVGVVTRHLFPRRDRQPDAQTP